MVPFYRFCQEAGCLSPGGGAFWVKGAAAVPCKEPFPYGPAHGIQSPSLDLPPVWEEAQVPPGIQITALIGTVIVQHLGQLLPGDALFRAKRPIVVAGYHPVLGGPGDG